MADQTKSEKELDKMVMEMEQMEKELEMDIEKEKQENDRHENGGVEGDDKFEPEHVRKLFVNNLNYRTTDETLRKYFEQFGEVINAVVVKYPNTERSRGFGYVTFATDEMVDETQKARPHRVDCRLVVTKRAVPRFDIRRPEISASVKRLYVNGLADEVDEDILAAYFRGFGKIMTISIVIDKVTGKKRGFAFIEFDDFDTVDKICLMKSHTICGKIVQVRKALTQFEMARMHHAGGDRGRGGGRGGGGGRFENPWANSGSFGSRYQQNDAPGPNRDNFGGSAGRPGPYNQGGGNYYGGRGSGGFQSSQNWGNNGYGNNLGRGRGTTTSSGYQSNDMWSNSYGGGYNGGGGSRGQGWNDGDDLGGSQSASSGPGGYGSGQTWGDSSFGGGVGGGGRGSYGEGDTGDSLRRLPTIDRGLKYRGVVIELARNSGIVSFEASPDSYQKARFWREDTLANGEPVGKTAMLDDLFQVGMGATLYLKEYCERPLPPKNDPSVLYTAQVNVIVPQSHHSAMANGGNSTGI